MNRSTHRLLGLVLAIGLILSVGYGLVASGQSLGEHQTFLPLIEKSEFHSISGQVLTPDGVPVPGVTILTADGLQAMTDSNGSYTISYLAGTEYRIIPSKDGYGFSPASALPRITAVRTGFNSRCG